MESTASAHGPASGWCYCVQIGVPAAAVRVVARECCHCRDWRCASESAYRVAGVLHGGFEPSCCGFEPSCFVEGRSLRAARCLGRMQHEASGRSVAVCKTQWRGMCVRGSTCPRCASEVRHVPAEASRCRGFAPRAAVAERAGIRHAQPNSWVQCLD